MRLAVTADENDNGMAASRNTNIRESREIDKIFRISVFIWFFVGHGVHENLL